MFTATSRYANLETAIYEDPSGRMVVYVRRRFVPMFAGSVLFEHPVVEQDRLDTITARYLGDPEQFWRICDANAALLPGDLTAEPGRRLTIPASMGG